MQDLIAAFPASCRLITGAGAALPKHLRPQDLPDYLNTHARALNLQPYLHDLSKVEWAAAQLSATGPDAVPVVTSLSVNPHLTFVTVSWRGLPELIAGDAIEPEPADATTLLWRIPGSREMKIATASGHDLLALKIVVEKMSPRTAAGQGGVSLGTITDILETAVSKGLLLAPPPGIARPPGFPRGEISTPDYFSSPVFTLQWHITQKCDLHCRHCYDRSNRDDFSLKQAVAVLDDTYDFCRSKNVIGQISFTGGNPFLHAHFTTIYREAAERGFMTAILGNPVPRHQLENIVAIRHPEFYQVSLEGMRAQNDDIRGRGHFDRVMDFLTTLKGLDIFSMVMLTLTKANTEDVLPLAAHLRGRADLFTFNRLTPVGEGIDLHQADIHDYPGLIERYLAAADDNPGMGLKDNLINISRYRQRKAPFGGCTGHGCGAAFNFVSLLPDGEVHACRKFPSPIGNILSQRLVDIYDGASARRYRSGTAACRECRLRPVCGGCMAVIYGNGLDIFNDRDPYCFIEAAPATSDDRGIG
ncbi:MAG: thio(seleno)oxazole modification radical SAM maturase SbtM [Pseudomonadota bacterium]